MESLQESMIAISSSSSSSAIYNLFIYTSYYLFINLQLFCTHDAQKLVMGHG